MPPRLNRQGKKKRIKLLCPDYAFNVSEFHSMDLGRGRARISTIRWALAASTYISGFSRRARFKRCTARQKARRVLTTILRSAAPSELGHGFLGATCSGRFAALGRMTNGKAGGVTIRPTIRRCLCLLIIRARPSKWMETRPSISSPMAFTRRCNAPKRRRMGWMCGWAAGRQPSGNIFRPD